MQPDRVDDPLFPKMWHGEERNFMGDPSKQKKAGQKNLCSRVAGIQAIADTQKGSVLARAWHCIYVSREGNF